jgi:hypothetical protein
MGDNPVDFMVVFLIGGFSRILVDFSVDFSVDLSVDFSVLASVDCLSVGFQHFGRTFLSTFRCVSR